MKITPRQSLSALNKDITDPSLINRIMRKTNSSNLPSIHAERQVASQQPRARGDTVIESPGHALDNQYLSYEPEPNEFSIRDHSPIRLDYIQRPAPSAPKAQPYATIPPTHKRKPESQTEAAPVTIDSSSDSDADPRSRVMYPPHISIH